MTYADWKAATVKKLENPKAANVREKVWKDAYIGNMKPAEAARAIDAEYHNKYSQAEREKRKRRK